ncbi:unnamed protein product [Citrullus colocynthis]|uniref:Secreted protein n=1 Tax=Citrullus colocynthis TaxID=252529 RepID=A0ABP0Z9W5_9ROSI
MIRREGSSAALSMALLWNCCSYFKLVFALLRVYCLLANSQGELARQIRRILNNFLREKKRDYQNKSQNYRTPLLYGQDGALPHSPISGAR